MFGQPGLHWQVCFIFKTLWNYKWLFNQWGSFCVLERMASDLLAPLCCDFLWKRPHLSFNFRYNISSFTQNIVQKLNQNFKLLLSDVLFVSEIFMWLFKFFLVSLPVAFAKLCGGSPSGSTAWAAERTGSVEGSHRFAYSDFAWTWAFPAPPKTVCVCAVSIVLVSGRKAPPPRFPSLPVVMMTSQLVAWKCRASWEMRYTYVG